MADDSSQEVRFSPFPDGMELLEDSFQENNLKIYPTAVMLFITDPVIIEDDSKMTVCKQLPGVVSCPDGSAPESAPDYIACTKVHGNGVSDKQCFLKKNGECPAGWEPEPSMVCATCCCGCDPPHHRNFEECCDN